MKAAGGARRKKKLILIVEPGETGLSTRKLLLEVAGYNVLSAISAKQALELDAEHPVHLVLLDLDAADLAAPDFIARVRRRRDKLPVHVLSSKPWLPEGLKGKADGVIEKLRDPKLMVERVEEIPK